MRTARAAQGRARARAARASCARACSYVAGRPELIWPIVLVGFIGTFGFNFPIWLSAFADKVFHGGAGMYGLFNTLMAAGSLAGALLAARRAHAPGCGMLVAAGALASACWRSSPPWRPSFWLFAAALVPIGMFGLTVNITANSTVQMATDPAMRGRVMGLFMMVFIGGTPLGAPLVGWVTDAYGARVGFAVGGAISRRGRRRRRPGAGPRRRPAPEGGPAPGPPARPVRPPGAGTGAGDGGVGGTRTPWHPARPAPTSASRGGSRRPPQRPRRPPRRPRAVPVPRGPRAAGQPEHVPFGRCTRHAPAGLQADTLAAEDRKGDRCAAPVPDCERAVTA